MGKHTQARPLFEESLALFKESCDKEGVAWSLYHLALVFLAQGEAAGVSSPQEQPLPSLRTKEYTADPPPAFGTTGQAPLHRGGYALANALFEEGLALFREVGDKVGFALCFSLAGQVALSQGDAGTARSSARESLRLSKETGYLAGMIESLTLLARVTVLQGDDMEAPDQHQSSASLFS
jgi:TPR repeat protein